MKRTHHFFDWTRPALAHAAGYLTRPDNWKNGLLDLSRQLIIVPSSHAGRRLRERLAVLAAEKNSAVLPGRIVTPSFLFQPTPDDPRPVADAIDSAILWQEVLSCLAPNDAPTLFRSTLPAGDRRACAAIARQLIELRSLLCEEGHTFASFARAYPANPEPERWHDLVRLESLYLKTLEHENLRDETTAKLAAAPAPDALREFESVHLLFCPDPPRLALRALEKLPDTIPLHIAILAPESEAARFDDWGRPTPDAWADGLIDLRDAQIRRFASPQEEIRFIADQLAPLPPEQRPVYAIGIPDGSLAPNLHDELAGRNMAAFDPAGCGAAQIALIETVLLLGRLFIDPAWPPFAAFVRHPYLLDFFSRKFPGFPIPAFLKALDTFQNEHLPSDFAAIRSFAENNDLLQPVVQQIADWMNRLETESPLSALQAILAECFAKRTFDNRRPDEADFIAAARLLGTVIDSLRRRPHIRRLPPSELMQIILDELEHQRIPSERPANAVDLPGWLELHWEDAPRLLLCGMTDTAVPEVIDCHPFLPDSARRDTGLRHNADRFARDAFIFRALIAMRAADPSAVQCCLSTIGLTGDPARPSRLLFLCAPELLPARALLLFGETPSTPPGQHRVNDWLLQPPPPITLVPHHLSVSDFNGYLRCPFLYYLENRLKMAPLDDTLQEMDAATYGSFCHAVFQDFAASPVADSMDEKEIVEYLMGRTAERFLKAFGSRLSLPLMIQQESMQESLRFAAKAQAKARREGWKLISAERKFTMPLRCVTLHGRIDRIERRDDGAVRLLDYKTSGKPKPPDAAHLKKQRDTTPPWALAPGEREWVNLQLPLYHLLYRNAFPDTTGPICCGYFNLPGVEETTNICEWTIDPELLESARDTADLIAGRILSGVFWPPRGGRIFPPLGDLFFDTPEQSVDAAAFPVEVE